MAINPNIALQVRAPQFESPVNQLAKVLQMQGLQQEQGMNRLRADKYRMEMDDYKRGQEENALLSRLYSDALKPDGTIDRNRLFSGAASGGLGSKIPGLQKTFADQDKATTDADAAKFKLAKDRYGMYQQTLGALSQEPNLSKELVLQAGQSLVQQGILPAELFQQAAATLPDDPEQLRARLKQGLAAQLPPAEIFKIFAPDPEKIDNGQTIGFRDKNPNSPTYGQQTGGAPVQRMQTPDNVATNTRMSLDAAARRDQSERQHKETMDLRRELAAAKGSGGPAKPLPPAALRLQQEEIDAVSGAAGIDADLGAVEKQLKDGKLKLSPIGNLVNQGRNLAGMSNEQSRNLQTLKSTLERLRNESLRLNKGVQTDGDSQRAWNELLTNINDPGVVAQRLAEIRALNRRAVALRSMNIQTIRDNYGQPPLDLSGRDNVAPTLGDGAKPPTGARTIERTGTLNGRKVVQYSDGTTEYAD